MQDMLDAVIDIAREAGAAVMDVYRSGDFGVEIKHEPGFDSPLTKADKLSNQIIEAGLKKISDLPIISEEGNHEIGLPETTYSDAVPGSQEEQASRTSRTVSERQTPADAAMRRIRGFWLVDPLDGTKEFVKQNGEFTVNIGLIENYRPILGVVLAPDKNVLYYGAKGIGAFRQDGESEPVKIEAKFAGKVPKIFVSRSYRTDQIDEFLAEIGEYEEVAMGSSLKFCLVADGSAALYPRFVECKLWDTAAAHAVLGAAGGTLRDLEGHELTYHPETTLISPNFVAAGKTFEDII